MAELTWVNVEGKTITAATASQLWWPTSILVLCEIHYFGIKHKSLTRLAYYRLFILKYPKVEVEAKSLHHIDYLYLAYCQRTSEQITASSFGFSFCF